MELELNVAKITLVSGERTEVHHVNERGEHLAVFVTAGSWPHVPEGCLDVSGHVLSDGSNFQKESITLTARDAPSTADVLSEENGRLRDALSAMVQWCENWTVPFADDDEYRGDLEVAKSLITI